jgi:hypothetical protein
MIFLIHKKKKKKKKKTLMCNLQIQLCKPNWVFTIFKLRSLKNQTFEEILDFLG